MRIMIIAATTLLSILSFAEATPACMRPISPLYVDIYGFDKHQMIYILESKIREVTITSKDYYKKYYYNSRFTLDSILEGSSTNKRLSFEEFIYNSKSQLIHHKKIAYKGLDHQWDLQMTENNSTELTVIEDIFKYNSDGIIVFASRKDMNLEYCGLYPTYLQYPHKMTIRLKKRSKGLLKYSCTTTQALRNNIAIPTKFWIRSGEMVGFRNRLCKCQIKISGDTSIYNIDFKSNKKRERNDQFLWGSIKVFDSASYSEKLYCFQEGWSEYKKLLVEKKHNSAGALLYRLDFDHWGRNDTTTYIRNKENNRIESISIHYNHTYTRHYIDKGPKTEVTESFEKLKFSYQ